MKPTIGGPIPEECHQCESVEEYLLKLEHAVAAGIAESTYTHINPEVPELWLGTKTKDEIFVINLEKVRKHFGADSTCGSNLQMEMGMALKWGNLVRAAADRGLQRSDIDWN